MVKGLLAAVLVMALAILLVGQRGVGTAAETPAVQFRDVTQQAGIKFVHNNGAFGKKYLPETMGPGVAFIDYDNDGWPDIFLVNGMNWPGHVQKHSTPKLYHNNHDGTFTDVTHKAGLDIEIFGMGVAVGDYDNDGYDDLFVTAYGQSHLFHNNGNGTFTDVTQKAGLQGPKEFSTSAAWVDYDKDGHLDLVVGNYVQITNFSNQMISLYHNEGKGLFVDEAPRSEIGRASLLTLGFGCFFFDYDLDGWPDVLVANGHIDADIQRVQANVKYAMPPHLFRNAGKGKFEEVTKSLGQAFASPRVGRGAAYADINNDGRLDLLLSTNGGPVYLFRNDAQGSAASNKSLRIKLIGTKSNRDGLGATVRVTFGGETQTQMLRSGSSYLSASELVLTFGLAQREKADTVEIRWPSGLVDRLSNIAAGQTVTVTEGKGITSSRTYEKKK